MHVTCINIQISSKTLVKFIPILRQMRLFSFFLVFFLSSLYLASTEASDHANPNGNITITWDLFNWTPDGYVAGVTINNYQKHRAIRAPGWRLGWTWAKNEVIWSVIGAQATNQGNCSKFKENIPHSCSKNPTIIDLNSGTPFDQQVANCCRGGVLASWTPRHPSSRSISAFQLSVGRAGTSVRTVKLPRKNTFKAPDSCYTCGPAKVVARTKFFTPDKRRFTRALMTWKIICKYSGARKSTT